MYKNKSFVEYYDNIPKVFKNIVEKYGHKFPSNTIEYLLKNTGSIIMQLKNYHNRPRPKEIARNYNILSDMYPNLRTKIMKEADNISLSRNIGRLHYGSDSQNGKNLGQALYKHYKNKENAL